MKTKVIALSLAVSLLPTSIYADPPPQPKLLGEVADLCIEVGAFFVLLGATCSAVHNGVSGWFSNWLWGTGSPPPPPTDPTAPPDDDEGGEGVEANAMPHLKASSVSAVDVFSLGWTDNAQPGRPGVYTNVTTFTLQSSTNLQTWGEVNIAVYKSTVGSTLIALNNEGGPLWTNYTPLLSGTVYSNYCPRLMPVFSKPKEFFRLLSQ